MYSIPGIAINLIMKRRHFSLLNYIVTLVNYYAAKSLFRHVHSLSFCNSFSGDLVSWFVTICTCTIHTWILYVLNIIVAPVMHAVDGYIHMYGYIFVYLLSVFVSDWLRVRLSKIYVCRLKMYGPLLNTIFDWVLSLAFNWPIWLNIISNILPPMCHCMYIHTCTLYGCSWTHRFHPVRKS